MKNCNNGILAVNDMHAAIDRFPKVVALVDSMRTIYPDLLLFAVGDNRTGNPANAVTTSLRSL
jgi:5'-nucleotidase